MQTIVNRILAIKVSKGFPLNDLPYDIQNIKNELKELSEASPEEIPDELADVIIFALGIAGYMNIDIETVIQNKLTKIEKRTITPLGNGQFHKVEGI